MTSRSLLISVFAAAAFAGCGDDGGSGTPADARIDSPLEDAAPPDLIPVDADTITKDVDIASPNSLYWDADASVLYLTNSNTNKLVKYTDAGGIADVIALPAANAPATISLGDIAKDGTGHLIANFGFGTDGTLFSAPDAGTATRITGLLATHRRIGLSRAPNGKLYEAYFDGSSATAAGGVAEVVITAGNAMETEIAGVSTTAGFKKLVGLVATNDTLYVSQQANPKTDDTGNYIYKITIATGAVGTVAMGFGGADAMTALPNGDLLVGGIKGMHRITTAGTVTAVTFGSETFADHEIHGIAYDAAMHRLFFVDQPTGVGATPKLRIRPFTP